MQKAPPWFLLVGWLSWLLAGCQPPPAYTTFQPPAGSNLQVTFEYPADWNLEVISPNQLIADENNYENHFALFVEEFVTEKALQEYLAGRIQGRLDYGINRGGVVRYEPLTLAGYPAYHITLDIPGGADRYNPDPWMQENYFLSMDKRLYDIFMNIHTAQRDSAFGRGFDHLIATLRVIEP